ncbi:hypothetical protein IW261DRAFT_934804 [Armillaria novae-zelandiae]|uniref:DUF6533 domain-containing protein n=1 Tax=Armillaria novae-zelandiae TaxID=153914 RepID=A0AA39PGB1_9AGAR|nr:hypothetical protein IW261DRAFT_934804 [Armillaria novae-zelandiae]
MDPHEVSQSLHDIRAVGSVLVASAALMIHEWAILFDQEVSLVWQSPWNLVKVLYLISRYSPILDVIIALEEHIRPQVNPKTCRIYDDISITSASVGVAIAELVLILRTCALYGNCKKMVYGLGTVWTTWVGVNFWVLTKYFKSSVFEPQPSPVLPGCYLARADPIFFIGFASLLLLDALQLVLQLYKAIKLRAHTILYLVNSSQFQLRSSRLQNSPHIHVLPRWNSILHVSISLGSGKRARHFIGSAWLAGLVGHIDACLSQHNVLPVAARTSPGCNVDGNRDYAHCSSCFRLYGVPNPNGL